VCNLPLCATCLCVQPASISYHNCVRQGERSLSRGGPTAGIATLSIILEMPHLAPWLVSYVRPQIYPAVKVLSMGCVAGAKGVKRGTFVRWPPMRGGGGRFGWPNTTDNKQLMHDVLPIRFFCLTGDDMQSPFLGDAALAVDHEALSRRAVRSVLAWMDEAAAPGVPHRVALKLLDDGRQASGSRVGGS